jgi:hypothetical protein
LVDEPRQVSGEGDRRDEGRGKSKGSDKDGHATFSSTSASWIASYLLAREANNRRDEHPLVTARSCGE